jgi:hypothetical protein
LKWIWNNIKIIFSLDYLSDVKYILF